MLNSRSLPAQRPAPALAAALAAVPASRQASAGRTGHVRLAALGVGMLVLLAAAPAFAQAAGGGGDLTTFLQNVVNILTGTAGRLIAVIAICIVGIGALMGALSLPGQDQPQGLGRFGEQHAVAFAQAQPPRGMVVELGEEGGDDGVERLKGGRAGRPGGRSSTDRNSRLQNSRLTSRRAR